MPRSVIGLSFRAFSHTRTVVDSRLWAFGMLATGHSCGHLNVDNFFIIFHSNLYKLNFNLEQFRAWNDRRRQLRVVDWVGRQHGLARGSLLPALVPSLIFSLADSFIQTIFSLTAHTAGSWLYLSKQSTFGSYLKFPPYLFFAHSFDGIQLHSNFYLHNFNFTRSNLYKLVLYI